METTMHRETRAALQRGLTMIGTCSALAIAGILVSAALRLLQEAHLRAVVEGVSSELASSLHYARSEAVARNQAVRFSFHASQVGRCYLVHTGDRGDCQCNGGAAQCDNGAEPLRSVFQPAGEPVQLAASVTSIVFNARDGTALPGGTFCVVPPGGRQIRHTVNVTGRVRICAPGATAGRCEPC
jgi:type IV fimbrial biogenesis protein FimT